MQSYSSNKGFTWIVIVVYSVRDGVAKSCKLCQRERTVRNAK